MQPLPDESFDKPALMFTAKFVLGVALLVSVAHWGTAFGAEAVIAVAFREVPDIEQQIEEVKVLRELRSYGEVRLLEKMEEYKSTLASRVIGSTSIDSLVSDGKFIGADLSAMKLYLFEDGHAIAEYDIQSKGKRGSRWETPTGLYEIQTKEEDHFSSIGEVHMPKAMQFFGNFFIHGWPFYPDGTPVSEGYSGGCIRLLTDDATEVFEFAEYRTPIFVWEDDSSVNAEGSASSTAISLGEKALPKVSANAFLVADIKTGEVYAEHNADTVLPIASISKLMTALVANETIHYDRKLAVTADDRKQTEGTPGSILSGDEFTVGDLIYALLMESNNSVAYALARYNGANNFLDLMNEKARAIGMTQTNFDDPSGISTNNRATVNDLFVLTRYIFNSQSFILNVSKEKGKTILAESGRKYSLGNFNVFADNPKFLGGKTGYTDAARETMTTVWDVSVDGQPATVAIIVLGSSDRKKDVEKLLAWFKASATTE
ncbi:MAG: D-alanyl-D-alanine endopeptidase (penicillin-binding protein 7) [Parcubacteria group bacterium Gr01-1014_8]|nr:MAG: D-alanyl-D-alanine endopeptidase (penicillin-binding protein 7) [Parcubacteria group bacterium Gr01-1014_8]